jgi:hypothetical protein
MTTKNINNTEESSDIKIPSFVPGMSLNEMFYHDVVRPLMIKHFPELKYSAGLVGHGSDVMGFDSEKSMDHNWGPHLHMFFSEPDFVAYKHKVDEMLRKNLPYEYMGFSTNFTDGDKYRIAVPKYKKRGEVNHLFEFWTPESFFMHYLGFNIKRKPSFQDWLLFPQQALIEVTIGKIFHDDLGVIDLRKSFMYYPDDIWKYMLAVQWGKVRDHIQFQARSGEEGDELGSYVNSGRSIQTVMFLCFLLERRYAPYDKWFGTAFNSWLKCSEKLTPLLLSVFKERDWFRRQQFLAEIYQELGKMTNALKISKPAPTKIIDYFGRGYPAIDAWEFEARMYESIENEQLKAMKFQMGNIDQFINHARINHMDYFYKELKDIIK